MKIIISKFGTESLYSRCKMYFLELVQPIMSLAVISNIALSSQPSDGRRRLINENCYQIYLRPIAISTIYDLGFLALAFRAIEKERFSNFYFHRYFCQFFAHVCRKSLYVYILTFKKKYQGVGLCRFYNRFIIIANAKSIVRSLKNKQIFAVKSCHLAQRRRENSNPDKVLFKKGSVSLTC